MRPWLPLVLASVCVLGATPATAQSLSFGGKGGVSISSISFDDPTLSSSSDGVGLVVGGFVGYRLSGRVSVQGEALFAETRVTVADIAHDKLSYLDIPVVARYRVFGAAPKLQVHAYGGVVLSSLLKARETVGSTTSDIKDAVEPRDVGFMVGGDVEVRPRITVDVRFLYGHEPIYKAYHASSFGLRRGMQVTVAYRVH